MLPDELSLSYPPSDTLKSPLVNRLPANPVLFTEDSVDFFGNRLFIGAKVKSPYKQAYFDCTVTDIHPPDTRHDMYLFTVEFDKTGKSKIISGEYINTRVYPPLLERVQLSKFHDSPIDMFGAPLFEGCEVVYRVTKKRRNDFILGTVTGIQKPESKSTSYSFRVLLETGEEVDVKGTVLIIRSSYDHELTLQSMNQANHSDNGRAVLGYKSSVDHLYKPSSVPDSLLIKEFFSKKKDEVIHVSDVNGNKVTVGQTVLARIPNGSPVIGDVIAFFPLGEGKLHMREKEYSVIIRDPKVHHFENKLYEVSPKNIMLFSDNFAPSVPLNQSDLKGGSSLLAFQDFL